MKTNFYFRISNYYKLLHVSFLIPPTARDPGHAEEVRRKTQHAEQVQDALSSPDPRQSVRKGNEVTI